MKGLVTTANYANVDANKIYYLIGADKEKYPLQIVAKRADVYSLNCDDQFTVHIF